MALNVLLIVIVLALAAAAALGATLPSLVRDAVRGYRTGRLDRVLAGDFDLFG